MPFAICLVCDGSKERHLIREDVSHDIASWRDLYLVNDTVLARAKQMGLKICELQNGGYEV